MEAGRGADSTTESPLIEQGRSLASPVSTSCSHALPFPMGLSSLQCLRASSPDHTPLLPSTMAAPLLQRKGKLWMIIPQLSNPVGQGSACLPILSQTFLLPSVASLPSEANPPLTWGAPASATSSQDPMLDGLLSPVLVQPLAFPSTILPKHLWLVLPEILVVPNLIDFSVCLPAPWTSQQPEEQLTVPS